jgi:hypothetical protein
MGNFEENEKHEEELIFIQHSFPSKKSAEKYNNIQIEATINRNYDKLNNQSIYEYVCRGNTFNSLIPLIPNLCRCIFLKELQFSSDIKKDIKYKAVFSKTGGLLNIFNTQVSEVMDKAITSIKDDNSITNEELKKWANTNSWLWSNLTPALVWAGTGELEQELMREFMDGLEPILSEGFLCEGEAILQSANFLRRWQLTSNEACKGLKPEQAIIEERTATLQRKVKSLRENGFVVNWL